MSNDNTVEAINTLLLIVRLAMESMEEAQKISDLIKKAQDEDRDLTAAELEKIKSKGDKAIARWQELSKG